jgi:hypothetical protein
VVLTNGNNGYPGSLFSGAATGSLTISNLPALLSGQTLMVSVTNAVVNVPATAIAVLPQIFPTAAIWTADFYTTNTATTTPYTQLGAIGAGTFWNPLEAASPYQNISALNDLQTTNTGVLITVAGTGTVDSAVIAGQELMDVLMSLPTSFTASGIVIDTVPGFYNVFLYSCESTWANQGCQFTVHGTTYGATNVNASIGNVPGQTGFGGGDYGPSYEDTSYILNTNMAIFTNVFISNGILDIGTQNVTVNLAAGGTSSSSCGVNGLQLQLIEPYAPLTFTETTPANVQLSWAGGVLQASGTVDGTFTNVTSAGAMVTSPYTVPAQPKSSAIFYLASPTNLYAPGIPIQ